MGKFYIHLSLHILNWEISKLFHLIWTKLKMGIFLFFNFLFDLWENSIFWVLMKWGWLGYLSLWPITLLGFEMGLVGEYLFLIIGNFEFSIKNLIKFSFYWVKYKNTHVLWVELVWYTPWTIFNSKNPPTVSNFLRIRLFAAVGKTNICKRILKKC